MKADNAGITASSGALTGPATEGNIAGSVQCGTHTSARTIAMAVTHLAGNLDPYCDEAN